MMNRHRLLCCVMSLLSWGLCQETFSAQKATLALTTTVPAVASASDRQLLGTLATLLEMQLLANDSVSIVERQQLDLVLHEWALNRSRTADQTLQLGQLATADHLVMLELRSVENASTAVLLRIVDARNAAIRGITSATKLDESSVDEIAEQFSRHIFATMQAPQAAKVTVAVAPFESVGRYDRLRPLELGIRDLVTARLLWRAAMPLRTNEDSKRAGTGPEQPREWITAFQVLKRSGMEELLRELELSQSELAKQDSVPRHWSERQAAFLIKGELDERQVDGHYHVIVRAELVDAAKRDVRDTFEIVCSSTELESRLALAVDRFAGRLVASNELFVNPAQGEQSPEAQALKRLAINDLRRFRRMSPIDFSPRGFRIPGDQSSRDIPRLTAADSALGKALLQKSIDRLESILFIHPHDGEAAYALAFCLSLKTSDFYQPSRSDELLRQVYDDAPQSELASTALILLAELGFDDQSCQLDAKQQDATLNRVWFAFEQMPETHRDANWPRLLELISKSARTASSKAPLLGKLSKHIDQATPRHRAALAAQTQFLAVQVALQASDDLPVRAAGMELLHRWAEGTDADLAGLGRQGLAAIEARNQNFLGAAILIEESAAQFTAAADRQKRDWQLTQAAKHYRLAKQPERALQLLRSFDPPEQMGVITRGVHGYEIGACLEVLGEKPAALVAYLNAAERCPLIVPNSDLVQRVTELGGVPLREGRSIDVQYIKLTGRNSVTNAPVTSDGRRLYIGGERLTVFDPEAETSFTLKGDLGRITCLKIAEGRLWLGTNGKGIWRYELSTESWKSFGTDQGLPDLRVTALAVSDGKVYASVGAATGGGLIMISSGDVVHLLDSRGAPQVAPTDIVVDHGRLLARTIEGIFECDLESGSWKTHQRNPEHGEIIASHLFLGSTKVWASNYGHELMLWDADQQTNQQFKRAWYFVPGTKAGYTVSFVAERGDEVWFGGQPWFDFLSAGLYRFDRKSGTFDRFSSADGFRTVSTQSIADGVWLNDKLWLTSSSGFCCVVPREKRQAEADTSATKK